MNVFHLIEFSYQNIFLCAPLDGYTDANSCFCLFVLLLAILLFSSLYFRFELREDRKREMVRTTGHMDSLRRDLNQTIARLSPVPPTIGLTPLISPSPYLGNPAFPQVSLSPTHTGSQFTRTHLDLRVGGGHQSNHASNSNFLIPPVLDGRSNFSLATPSSYDDEILGDRQLHSSLDFDCLRADIVAGVRYEIREALHQTLSEGGTQSVQAMGPDSATGNAVSLPPTSADLYHTHLYTQL